ncbi:MAG: hypothetical protein IJY94_02390 [Clostridia bacterium]|nr:hypothetical protein [Clostridia bacterium]
MSNVLKSLCVFMSFIVICTFCGGLFGIVAGGTFVSSMRRFGNAMSLAKKGLIDPLSDFLDILGLTAATSKNAVVYLRDNDDYISISTGIPDDAVYAAYVAKYQSNQNGDVGTKLAQDAYELAFIVYFDASGLPLDIVIISISARDDFFVEVGGKFIGGLYSGTINYIDFSSCYFNTYSNVLYFDISLSISLFDTTLHRLSFVSSLKNDTFAGDFTKLQSKYFPIGGTGGKF